MPCDHGIPVGQQVTTAQNLRNGVGVVRPPDHPCNTGASAGGITSWRAGSPSPGPAPGVPPPGRVPTVGTPGSVSPFGGGWTPVPGTTPQSTGQIQAVIEMMSSAPTFVDEYSASVPGFALTLADRLHWAIGVPLSRFAFYIPDPHVFSTTHFCYCNNNEEETSAWIARFAAASNSTFKCTKTPDPHKLNSTVLKKGSLLQSEKSVSWEVAIYPPSNVHGDVLNGAEVGEDIVYLADSPAEPERNLLRNGTWTYKAGRGVKFLGLLPATFAAWPGKPFPRARDTSVALGPNPGGLGAMPPTTLPPELAEEQRQLESDQQEEQSLKYVDNVVHEADKLNTAITNSVEELSSSLYRAAKAHAAVMNIDPYTLPPELD